MMKKRYLLIAYGILQGTSLLSQQTQVTHATRITQATTPTVSSAMQSSSTITTIPVQPTPAYVGTTPVQVVPSHFIPVPVNYQTQTTLQSVLKKNPTVPLYPKKLHYDQQDIIGLVACTALATAFITQWTRTPLHSTPPKAHASKPYIPSPPKRPINRIIDQQYAQLDTIACAYEDALRDNQWYQSGPYRSRIENRLDAIKEWHVHPHKKTIIQSHEWFSHVQHTFLNYSRFAHSAYTTITADPIQRALHKEITSIARILSDFHTQLTPGQPSILFNHAVLLMELSRSYNGSNIIVQALNAADVCWEIIEAANTVGPTAFFSQETEQAWHQWVLYSHAKLPDCSVDWDQFEYEKHRADTIQTKCKQLLDGCCAFVRTCITTVEESLDAIDSSLMHIAIALDNFVLHDVFVKIDMFAATLSNKAASMARRCKEKVNTLMQTSKATLINVLSQAYACLPSPRAYIKHATKHGTSLLISITMNALALYLMAQMFSATSELVSLKMAGLMSIVMQLIHNGSIAGALGKTLLQMAHAHPIQAVIIGAALLTPLVSPLIETYCFSTKKTASVPHS